jgi:hypothetical protein
MSTDKLAEAIARLRGIFTGHESLDEAARLVCTAAESAPRVPDAQQVSAADELIARCGRIARKHAEQRQRYDASYSEAELSASAHTAAEIADEIEALEATRSLAPETCPLPEKWRAEIEKETVQTGKMKGARSNATARAARYLRELESWLASQREKK